MTETICSDSYAGPPPDISVVISTHRRPAFLPDLIGGLEGQDIAPDRLEVVVVDDGSADGPGGTWHVLQGIAAKTSLRLLAVKRQRSGGPAAGRNEGSRFARGAVLVFTDDDCIPQPGWLDGLFESIQAGSDLVQGRTLPDPSGLDGGPWARTIAINSPTPFFETCNVAYRRSWFERLGGFDERDALTAPGAGRHFGEDVVLGARLVGAGGRADFCGRAVVYHRWLPASYADHLRHQRRLAGFPGLALRSAVLADWLWLGVFLSTRAAAFDLAVVGALIATSKRRAGPLVLALPWVYRRWPDAVAKRAGRPAVVRLGQLAVSDLVGLASLIEGSVRYRRLIL